MSQKIYLLRHGETLWTKSRQHTGRTDIPLTEEGKREAGKWKPYFASLSLKTLVSPLIRAKETAIAAGLTSFEEEPLLLEWDYGLYDGKTTKEIQEIEPHWHLFQDGAKGGETIEEVGRRADQLISRFQKINEDIIVVSHGHFLRVLGARWLKLDPSMGKLLYLSTASLSILSYEHNSLEEPVLLHWNITR